MAGGDFKATAAGTTKEEFWIVIYLTSDKTPNKSLQPGRHSMSNSFFYKKEPKSL
jgi:hypothetical protein